MQVSRGVCVSKKNDLGEIHLILLTLGNSVGWGMLQPLTLKMMYHQSLNM